MTIFIRQGGELSWGVNDMLGNVNFNGVYSGSKVEGES